MSIFEIVALCGIELLCQKYYVKCSECGYSAKSCVVMKEKENDCELYSPYGAYRGACFKEYYKGCNQFKDNWKWKPSKKDKEIQDKINEMNKSE